MMATTSFPEDHSRLPEGTTRVGYDADTARYAFRDAARPDAVLVGAPGEEYGQMVPEAHAVAMAPKKGLGRRPTVQAYDRPARFAPDGTADAKAHAFDGPAVNGTGMTFSDILPAHLLGSAEPMDAKKPPRLGSPKKSSFDAAAAAAHSNGRNSPGMGKEEMEARRRTERRSEEYSRAGGHSRKTSFRSAAKIVGRAAGAFRAKQKEDGVGGAYARVE